jgi:hypothetical protein
MLMSFDEVSEIAAASNLSSPKDCAPAWAVAFHTKRHFPGNHRRSMHYTGSIYSRY